MLTSAKKSVLSPDLLVAVRAKRDADDPRVDSQLQLKGCDELGTYIAQGALKQLTACGMTRPVEWTRHRALVIGYVCGMSDARSVVRWAAALSCLNALAMLLGPEWEEDALCVEAQKLRDQEHPGYLAGLKAAAEDAATVDAGKVPASLARSIIDREMHHR